MARKEKKPKKFDKAELGHPPALKSYLERIGAETLNFRRAMVKERSKGDTYYIERTLVKIAADGAIECSRKEHAPTKDEAEKIKEEFTKGEFEFPKSICATQASFDRWLAAQTGDRGRFFGLWDRKEGGYRMVQERIQLDSGEKVFIPHTLWSDNEWRKMEPEGALPFWKPKEKTGTLKIMVHEGCKTAKFMNDLLADKERLALFPWRDFVSRYEHWGMIGGALAPHRTNYDDLKRERPSEVIYCCDHDYPGESALQEISKHWGLALKGIKYGKHFPYTWDMADEFPKELFSRQGRYIGPMLEALIEFATKATELVPTGEKGRPAIVLRRAFKEEWLHSVQPEVYIHKDWPSRIFTAPEFNSHVSPYSDAEDTAKYLRRDGASKTSMLKYDPSKDSGIYGDQGRYINTHVGTDKLIPLEKGDYSPFVEFMKALIPEAEDRLELERWCATLIAKPDIKMGYGVLLISEAQGVGKTTLGEKILAPLMGRENVSTPSESDICGTAFNYWCAHKRLAIVNEIYAGHSTKAYNALKGVITDKVMTVNKKFQAAYEIDNWVHVFACSNSMRALQLSFDDRRWLVPKVTEEKQEFEFWEKFNNWLVGEGGLGKIKHWAKDFLKKNEPVLRGAHAPWTVTKGEIVEEGYSPGMALVAAAFDRLNEELKKPQKDRWSRAMNGSDYRVRTIEDDCIVLDTDLVDLIRNKIYDGRQSDRLEKPLTVRKVAKQKGWHVVEAKASTIPGWGLVGTSAKLLVPCAQMAKKTPGEFVKNGSKPIDVKELMQL